MSNYEEPREVEFKEGFTIRTVIGAIFVALVMMPASIYLSLIAGQTVGPAAQWVTIILFTEIARRSFTTLRRQEVYLLYYMAMVLAMAGGAASPSMTGGPFAAPIAAGGPFGPAIWNQYLKQSTQAIEFGISDLIPQWIVPPGSSEALVGRDLWHGDWWRAANQSTIWGPVTISLFLWIMGRVSFVTVGYGLFRITSDVERLSFPMAPIAAEGATALAETTAKKETWRWNVFSTGAAIGMIFGAIYVGVPSFTGVVFNAPLQIIPIPFVDLTETVHQFLPASLAAVSIDLGAFIIGMVLPFPMVCGQFVASTTSGIIVNPILHNMGLLPQWKQGMSLIPTQLAVSFDFWMSISIGSSLCVATIGIYKVIKGVFFTKLDSDEEGVGRGGRSRLEPPPGRGDIGLHWVVIVYIIAAVSYIWLSKTLLKQDEFPWAIMLTYAIIITPVISYVTARMIGLTGMPIPFPFLREGGIILSGYRGIDIWYAPLPLADYGMMAGLFRELTLTRTKFTSLVKIELLMLPLVVACSYLFWSFFWSIESIPSASYPFTAKMWPLMATQQCLFMTATTSDNPMLLEALKGHLVLGGFGFGYLLFAALSLLQVHPLFFYGCVGGIGAPPTASIPMFFGAMVGRQFFRKKYGEETWRRYTPVLMAGYLCGMGLVGMLSVAFAMIAKTISSLPF